MEIKKELIIVELQQLLVQRFGLADSKDKIPVDAPLFSSEVGLCSIDGLELLTELESHYGVSLSEDLLFAGTPTLELLAGHLAKTAN